ncbi:hypothetical protein MTO98_21340 [Mucilaginibacter sp. SMC90]|uniref:hypothetical protein n=1 Tax=Mucilaginibacter sp. SMC90 TaxID=2929803 RepID=UPI001FB45760|nr:hypothetical protein [Mucilaginibacter sp. SMC90]UOE46952.1 hypothetical protein MTO98_21340 [Mucilaginibacter sp. SMC90]
MATNNMKKIGKNPQVQYQDSNAWEVMRPFVHFGIKAAGAIAHTLIYIVKHIPKPDSFKTPERKNNKVIKIRTVNR